MNLDNERLEKLVSKLLALPRNKIRTVIALAGAPASGKSTLAQILADKLSDQGRPTVVVPMDGFHLDNRILKSRKIFDRKGAPETFDLGGLNRLLDGLQKAGKIYFPLFDRHLDVAIAGAGEVSEDCDTVIVEGNYLLLNEPGWNSLNVLWDYSIWLEVPQGELRKRLCKRWVDSGLSAADAANRAEKNDIPNAMRTISAITGYSEKFECY